MEEPCSITAVLGIGALGLFKLPSNGGIAGEGIGLGAVGEIIDIFSASDVGEFQ